MWACCWWIKLRFQVHKQLSWIWFKCELRNYLANCLCRHMVYNKAKDHGCRNQLLLFLLSYCLGTWIVRMSSRIGNLILRCRCRKCVIWIIVKFETPCCAVVIGVWGITLYVDCNYTWPVFECVPYAHNYEVLHYYWDYDEHIRNNYHYHSVYPIIWIGISEYRTVLNLLLQYQINSDNINCTSLYR